MWSRTEPSSTIRAIHSSWPRAKNGAPTVRRPSAYALKGAGPSNTFRLPSRCRTTNRKRITPVTAMSTFFPINERAKRGVTGDGATTSCVMDGGMIRADGGGVQASPSHARLEQTVDRKSTRLNSSHTVISYAVFCLKKKKIKDNTM